MIPKYKIFIVLGIIVLVAIVSFFTIFSNKNYDQGLVMCVNDEEIWRLRDQKSTTKDIEEENKIIEGFYINKNALRLDEWTERVTEKLELTDFIKSYWPPTPLLGLQQKFQDGDLIELEIEEYANLWPGKPLEGPRTILVLRVSKARKLPLPTKSEFLDKARQVFDVNAKTIFHCANSKVSNFPSFEKSEPSIYWDRVNQQAFVIYQGTKDNFFGIIKIVTVGIILDKDGKPLSILVGSHVAPLE